jgi:hypothetical protein
MRKGGVNHSALFANCAETVRGGALLSPSLRYFVSHPGV